MHVIQTVLVLATIATLRSTARWTLSSCGGSASFSLRHQHHPQAHVSKMGSIGAVPLWDALEAQGGCTTPLTGTFSEQHPARVSSPWCVNNASCCSARRMEGGRHGVWRTAQQWQQGNHCAPSWLQPEEIMACLKGRVLAFEGDSVTRQLINRLIWWLRGLPAIWEHHYSVNAIYEFDRHRDMFRLLKADGKPTPVGKPPFGRHPDENGTFRGTFPDQDARLASHVDSWLTRSTSRAGALLTFRWGGIYGDGADAQLRAGKKEWSQRDTPRLSGNASVYGKLARDNNLLAGIIIGRHGHFKFEAPAPSGEWTHEYDTLDLDTMNANGGASHYYARNLLYVAERKDPRMGNIHSLLSRTRWNQTWDMPEAEEMYSLPYLDMHFQCAFMETWPQAAASWKMPITADCRDLLGLNAIQAILGRVCHSKPRAASARSKPR